MSPVSSIIRTSDHSFNTRIAFPNEWASTQINLGATYSDYIKDDSPEYLEQAITAFTGGLYYSLARVIEEG
ncbi:MAG: hypothetical protein KME28_02950 [Pelatocladus maniniholoensis HA4357-MV3]|uniref:Uncharacterized protein n=1 Tax=Pelatocladus maniniholoensis HA4357-MV3 TaxID=1117104 RepID=A0A9E3LS21_9NOST|nr:hypothetical protein [Pelatocladus maniniholoensis HA4357-MV3]